jgi:hypothetical protein
MLKAATFEIERESTSQTSNRRATLFPDVHRNSLTNRSVEMHAAKLKYLHACQTIQSFGGTFGYLAWHCTHELLTLR